MREKSEEFCFILIIWYLFLSVSIVSTVFNFFFFTCSSFVSKNNILMEDTYH